MERNISDSHYRYETFMKLVHLNDQETDLEQWMGHGQNPKHFFRYGDDRQIVDLVIDKQFRFGMYLIRQSILDTLECDEEPWRPPTR